ncbi:MULTISPECIES: S9 family peptidase [Shewanella]|uniref:Dipeptidyl aminopeptidase/acylaminoacyl peptidase n=1 Tax=Shewanella fodinae TaxID=552357 RepID=A0A4R2F8K2_9GAMM|nr:MULTISPECIES: DPP IV N-terminal domain-containing protein [Shewanella]MBO1271280.1 DPP IV N-terminal domain-containing protein [Shewanella sp. 4t3-1-2LB]TCN83048.1 dipeptidyl aminopeptidase/acylaminoacyl peptidase [Shewanella fodinae]
MTHALLPRFLASALLLMITSVSVMAATAADIRASVELRQNWQVLTRNLAFPAHWLPGTHEFYYRVTVAGGFAFIKENADNGQKGPAFDQTLVANGLSKAQAENVTALALPFDDFWYEDDGIGFYLHYEPWHCSLTQANCAKKPETSQPMADDEVRDLRVPADNHLRPSPDGKLQAHVVDHNLQVVDQHGKIVLLSQEGTAGNFYDPQTIQWSPDSRYLVIFRVTPGYARYVTRVLSSPQTQLQPEVIQQLYPKPGDAIDMEQPVLFDLHTGKHTDIDASLFPNAYDLANLYWRADSKTFAFEYTRRGHQQARLIEVDAASGKGRVVIDETSNTFIYQWRGYRHDVSQLGKEVIWLSERDGWAHLYLYDGKRGKVKNLITQGNWPVREVVHVDDEKRQIWFAASGVNAGEDPYFVHYYRVNFDGSGLTEITQTAANHHVSFSDDMQYFVDNYSRVDLPNVAELKKADGTLVRVIAKADISQLTAAGFKAPQVFVAKGRDGKSDIWGLIVKPQHFDPSKHYPVIENIYAGPHDSFVPKDFWPFGYHSGGDKVIGMQALANLGFIVVQMDGMGTANRSKAFHDVAWKNLGDSGFPDRILWHQAAAKKFPWYDISNGVGIYGASAGGQSTLSALLFHPEFYSVGVAFAGCYDNRMDKMSWNEQWMGWPVDDSYLRSSAVVNAAKLQGQLLIIFGEQDSNVDPSSSLQLVNALINANKDFELLEVPGGEHSVGRSTGPIDYVQRRQFMFFIKHLLQQPTPNWNKQ